MRVGNNKAGFSLVELIVAFAIIVIIFAAVVPQFKAIQNSWAGEDAGATVTQNARVLMEHISRNLSKARQITMVSSPSSTSGYIYFVDNDGNTCYYQRSGSYICYGTSNLAGPVSGFKVSGYSLNDFNNTTMDVNIIRVVKIDVNFTNSSLDGLSRNQNFSTWVYLNPAVSNSVGHWKLDETSGLFAADSSGCGHDGNLVNMTGNEWTTGQIGGALAFDGTNKHVRVTNMSNYVGSTYTVSFWVKPNTIDLKELVVMGTDCSTHNFEFYQSYSNLRVRADAGSGDDIDVNNVFTAGQWVHICGVCDGNGTRVYVDGVLRGSTSVIAGTTTGYNLNIGAWDDGEYCFNGVIDDVRICNRVLTADEIAEMANILRYRSFNEYKMSFFYPFCSIPTPSPVNAGDLLVAAVVTYGNSSSLTPPDNNGWTKIDCTAYNGTVTLGAWWKVARAGEPSSHTFSGGSGFGYGWMMRFTGQDPVNPINAVATASQTSSSPTSPAVTTTAGNCLILRLGGFKGDDIAIDSPGLPGHIPITMDEASDSNKTVTYQGYSEAKVNTDNGTITIPKPAGTSQTDFLIACVATDGNTWASTWSAPSGWNSVATCFYAPSCDVGASLKAWEKVAGASEPDNYTFTWYAPPEQAYGWIIRLSGPSLGDVGYPSPTTGISSSPPLSASYPPGPGNMTNFMCVRIGAFNDNAITVGNPGLAGYTPITMNCSSSGDGSVSGGAGYIFVPTITQAPATNFSLTASEAYATISLFIWPSNSYGNTCSGGAGYVVQSAAGSSGTSDFSLCSSTDARMITIAIAPADANSGNCCGSILP